MSITREENRYKKNKKIKMKKYQVKWARGEIITRRRVLNSRRWNTIIISDFFNSGLLEIREEKILSLLD